MRVDEQSTDQHYLVAVTLDPVADRATNNDEGCTAKEVIGHQA